MKKSFLFIATCLLFLDGCAFGIAGSGNVITEKRSVEKFSGITLQCAANVYFTQGDQESVSVEGEDNIVPLITTTVKNGKLVIDAEKEYSSTQPVNVHVTVKELCWLELAGSGNMIGRGPINCDRMTLRVDGSGDLKIDVHSLGVKMSLSGSGNLDVNGVATETDVRIAGSGNVNSEKLKANSGAVIITGSGIAKVNTTDELNVQITGSGNVQFVSQPPKFIKNITGSGTVTKI